MIYMIYKSQLSTTNCKQISKIYETDNMFADPEIRETFFTDQRISLLITISDQRTLDMPFNYKKTRS